MSQNKRSEIPKIFPFPSKVISSVEFKHFRIDAVSTKSSLSWNLSFLITIQIAYLDIRLLKVPTAVHIVPLDFPDEICTVAYLKEIVHQ
jgi:hypothetical protein